MLVIELTGQLDCCCRQTLGQPNQFYLLSLDFDCSHQTLKEAALERADFTLQLLFVTPETEQRMFRILFLSSFCQLLSPRF